MNILIIGGAGYIGSHMVKMLHLAGHQVVTLDNLSTGHADAVRYGTLVIGDMADAPLLDQLFSEHHFDAVMHFAAASIVGESTVDPAKYYRNNVANTLTLLDVMIKHGVLRFIFSSTAATFGTPTQGIIDEAHLQQPINPYGRSKLMIENILSDYDSAYNLKSVSLRYFNAAGADPDCELGERHDPETHLIPIILQVASGRRESINVFGTDYNTPDGTCLRDYIHVTDLCKAHLLALNRLSENRQSAAYNLGNGEGYSVQEVIDAAVSVTGRRIPVVKAARRPGDPDRLVADAKRARSELGWVPQYPDLKTIVQHAWEWEILCRSK